MNKPGYGSTREEIMEQIKQADNPVVLAQIVVGLLDRLYPSPKTRRTL